MRIKVPESYKIMVYKGNRSEYYPGSIYDLKPGDRFRIFHGDWKVMLDKLDETHVMSNNIILDYFTDDGYMEFHIDPTDPGYLSNCNQYWT